jgi:hypothetical protein
MGTGDRRTKPGQDLPGHVGEIAPEEGTQGQAGGSARAGSRTGRIPARELSFAPGQPLPRPSPPAPAALTLINRIVTAPGADYYASTVADL